jgi:hypothetical protein
MKWTPCAIARLFVLLALGTATPALAGCGTCPGPPAEVPEVEEADAVPEPSEPEPAPSTEVPTTAPEGWDPIAFNRDRGNAGSIPESYRDDINGPDGETAHLGKHLPYVPDTTGLEIPEGYIALMWGDPTEGYARHPNAPKGAEAYPEGHWYDWVKIRKAVDAEAEEVETTFGSWPEPGADDSGEFLVAGGGAIEDDGGKNTIYLVKLPPGVQTGDTIRVWAHCLYHGEYVDFIEIP